MKSISLIALFIAVNAIASPWRPSVRIGEHRVVGRPAENHQGISGISMTILEQENCDAKVLNPNIVEFSDSCQLLQGYYTYSYEAEGHHSTYVEFLVNRVGNKSHTYLVNSPITIDNSNPLSETK